MLFQPSHRESQARQPAVSSKARRARPEPQMHSRAYTVHISKIPDSRPGASIATPDGTQRYAQRFASKAKTFALHPRYNLTLSNLGIGTMRASDAIPAHTKALTQALLSGVNVIDTSPSYRNNNAELLVGDVVNDLIGESKISRDEIVVTTKLGFLRGNDLKDAQMAKDGTGKSFAFCKELTKDMWYALSPDYAKFQLTKSLARLRLKSVDGVFIESPETILPPLSALSPYFPPHTFTFLPFSSANQLPLRSGSRISLTVVPFLSARAAKQNVNVKTIQAEFQKVMMPLFYFLETQVQNGVIGWYGVSSANFTTTDPARHVPLNALLSIANQLSPDHHFAGIQYPLNLLEPEAYTKKIYAGQSLQEFANENKLMHFPVRALTAALPTVPLFEDHAEKSKLPPRRYDPMMLRLVGVPSRTDIVDLPKMTKQALDGAIVYERDYKAVYEKYHKTNPEIPAPSELMYGHIIGANMASLNLEAFKAFAETQVRPVLPTVLRKLTATNEETLREWSKRYLAIVFSTLDRFQWLLEFNRHSDLLALAKGLETIAPELTETQSMAGKAIRCVLSTDKPASVLVGMRHIDQVAELVGTESASISQPLVALKPDTDVQGLFSEVGAKFTNDELKRVQGYLDRVVELSNNKPAQ